MHRITNRASLVEVLLPAGLGRNDRLDKISNLLDWSALEGMLSGVYAAPKGRPSYPPLLMVKVLLLEQWSNLSDPEMEAALGDRLSFRRFVGLGLEDATPDHSTISRFRKELTQRGLGEALFGEVGRQLEVRGMVLKEGTLLDATLVEAQVRKPPAGSGLGRRSDQDPDADWTRKYGRSYFGYKVHLGVDKGSGLIRQAVLTSAKVSDSEIADSLVAGDEQAVYADRGYESKRRRRWLQSQGIKDRIMHRSHKHQAALPYWQQRRNRLIAPRRAAVERVFGTLKRTYHYTRVRYLGLSSNTTELWFKCLAYNLRRAGQLADTTP